MIEKKLTKKGNTVILEVTSQVMRVWQRRSGAQKQVFNTESAKKYLTDHGLTGYIILEESIPVGNSADISQSGQWIFEKEKKKPKKKTSATTSRSQK
tara:strand:- start:3887 stop:4177 length:291 start_codon:yes stop_codon:yes gene_type:complete